MRRGLSIFLVLFFGLGPLSAVSQSSDESRLPPCCRRHGAHHCAMSDAMMARMVQAASGTPAFSAPAHCPFYPGAAAAAISKARALVAPATALPVLLAQFHTPAAGPAAARTGQFRTQAGRSPPPTAFA